MQKLMIMIATTAILLFAQLISMPVIAQTTENEAYQDAKKRNDFTAFCRDYSQHWKCVEIAYRDAKSKKDFANFCHDYPQQPKCIEIGEAFQKAKEDNNFAIFCSNYPKHPPCPEILSEIAYQFAKDSNDFTALCRNYPQHQKCIEIKETTFQEAQGNNNFVTFCRDYSDHPKCLEIEAYQVASEGDDFSVFCGDYPQHQKCIELQAYRKATESNGYTAFCGEYLQHPKCVEMQAYQDANQNNDYGTFCRDYPEHSQCIKIEDAYKLARDSDDYTAFCIYYPKNSKCVEMQAYQDAKKKGDFTAFCIDYSQHSYCRCGISVGDTAIFNDPAEIYNWIQEKNLVKDEFETTATFEKRVAEAEAVFSKPILIRGTYDREHTKYDADNSRIVMKMDAWAKKMSHKFFLYDELREGVKESTGFESPLKDDLLLHALLNLSLESGTRQVSDNAHGTVLLYTEEVTGTYRGSDNSGNSAEVTQISKTSYAVLDEVDTSQNKMTWKNKRIRFNMPVEKAKRIISKLQVGIMALPKKPFTKEARSVKEATFADPTEITESYQTIFADMVCAVIADDKGRVLKTVETAY